jgi:transcriptional regulator with XRE-family HTH domain
MFPLGRQVKAIRILYDIKQQELADRIGVGRTYLSLFENGQTQLTDEQTARLGLALGEIGVASKITIELPKELAVAA